MNIVIDQGNTLAKIGLFDSESNLVKLINSEELTEPVLESMLKKYHPDAGILSSVKDMKGSISVYLQEKLGHFVHFQHSTPIPIQNKYATPETLGLDRLAAAVGAWSLKPGIPLLIVDMGTAITFDYVSPEGIFEAGNIAPGLRMRLRALHQFTDRLPLIEPDVDFPFLGTSTQEAIRSGVMNGIRLETDGYVELLRALHPGLFAFLTGGDLIFFADKLKNGIFVHENLVLTGLNRILCSHEHA
jgi:type III pantothenate kinase